MTSPAPAHDLDAEITVEVVQHDVQVTVAQPEITVVTSGPPGPRGPAGPTGPAGPAGGQLLQGMWNYDSSVSGLPPLGGEIRFNNTNPSLATEMLISEYDMSGVDRSLEMDVANSLPSALLLVRGSDGGVVQFTATPGVDNGTWRTTLLSNGAGSNFLLSPVDVTVVASTGGGGGHTIQDEGTDLVDRPVLNFTGSGVVATDDPGNSRTNITIAGGGSAAGKYRGVWNSSTPYDAGDTVFHIDGEWGAENAIAAGNPPNDTGTLPPTTQAPVGADLVANAALITVATDGVNVASPSFMNTGYGNEVNEPGDNKNWTAWWKYMPISSGPVEFNTVGVAGDTVLVVYRLTTPTLVDFSSLTQVAYDDDSGGGQRSKVTYTVTAGETYYISEGAWQPTAVWYVLNLVGARATAGAPIASPWKRLSTIDGGGGGSAEGAAGGDLTGTYPDPQIAAGVIVDADVNAAADIDQTKIKDLANADYSTFIGRDSGAPAGIGAIVIGTGQTSVGQYGVSIGPAAYADGNESVAVGENAGTSGTATQGTALGPYARVDASAHSTAVGANARVSGGQYGVAVGGDSHTYNAEGTAVGYGAEIWANKGSAFGSRSRADHAGSTAVGADARTTKAAQVRLGVATDEVSVPGKLVLSADPATAMEAASKQYVDSRTPKITPGLTPPPNPAVNDIWVDTN